MILQNLLLHNFRNYTKSEFAFTSRLTVIVAPNAYGKTNLVEALFLLATGKSFRTDKEKQLIQFGKPVARVRGRVSSVSMVSRVSSGTDDLSSSSWEGEGEEDGDDLEVVVSESEKFVLQKKYLVNGVSKRRIDFAGRLPMVLFTPLDLDIVSGQPSGRRRFLDEVLEQVDMEYRVALTTYMKALRQRNALLEQVQDTGLRDEDRFAYWDTLLIRNGSIIAKKRTELIEYINSRQKDIFPCTLIYDKSVMSRERLLQYKDAEVGAGVTLVGPQRDDVIIRSPNTASGELEDVKYFCSRGQQRLVTLELKLSQISYIKEHNDAEPILVLDDIFSELDSRHISKVLQMASDYQTIITTTHREFVEDLPLSEGSVIELR